eukprot:CAMPEP_0113690554 /NCGR_PEP_ID=MMETSP0038_2-20120614/17863_1 /TAXON_ID=2898 /ORGANISM="Cryptomonas paramecium" /LENGTH=35 /DNA_ID=CAMNT_0000611907 /DNA_START=147 /DNA_END=255 /DNA_ORIENTATION=- /assembly_acc=CAM_ASM_000170
MSPEVAASQAAQAANTAGGASCMDAQMKFLTLTQH